MPFATFRRPLDPGREVYLPFLFSCLAITGCGPRVPASVRAIGPAEIIECRLPPSSLGDIVSFDMVPPPCGPPDIPTVNAHVEADGSYRVRISQQDLGEGGDLFTETRLGCFPAETMRAIRDALSVPESSGDEEVDDACAPRLASLSRVGAASSDATEAARRIPTSSALAVVRILARSAEVAPPLQCEGRSPCVLRFFRCVRRHVHGQSPSPDILEVRRDGIVECRNHDRAEARRLEAADASALMSYLVDGIPLQADAPEADDERVIDAPYVTWSLSDTVGTRYASRVGDVTERWNAVARRVFPECSGL